MKKQVEQELTFSVSEAVQGVAQKAKKGFWGALLSKILSKVFDDIIEAVLDALKNNDKIDINLKQ